MFQIDNLEMSDSAWNLNVAIESIPNKGCDLITQIIAKVSEMGWDDGDIFKIHMALEEAIMNAIKHGNELDASKEVSVDVTVEQDWFYADIKDEGQGFEREDVPDPTLEQNLLKESGRGLMLIEKFMSSVEYVGCGNRVKMSKKKSENSDE